MWSSTCKSHDCPCCGNGPHRIGEDVSEKLDIVPAQFRVLVTRRPKYACRACEEVVVQAPALARLIEGGLPTEATVAQVLVSKYADHLRTLHERKSTSDRGSILTVRHCRLGRSRCLALAPGSSKAARASEGLVQTLRRRDDRPSARSGSGKD